MYHLKLDLVIEPDPRRTHLFSKHSSLRLSAGFLMHVSRAPSTVSENQVRRWNVHTLGLCWAVWWCPHVACVFAHCQVHTTSLPVPHHYLWWDSWMNCGIRGLGPKCGAKLTIARGKNADAVSSESAEQSHFMVWTTRVQLCDGAFRIKRKSVY